MLNTATTDQLIYFAILIWAEDNKPYPIPEGGYVIDIAEARSRFQQWLNLMGREEFIAKTGIDRFFASKAPKQPRVSKQEIIEELKQLIADLGLEVDSSLIDKLTGKQALYFSNIIK